VDTHSVFRCRIPKCGVHHLAFQGALTLVWERNVDTLNVVFIITHHKVLAGVESEVVVIVTMFSMANGSSIRYGAGDVFDEG